MTDPSSPTNQTEEEQTRTNKPNPKAAAALLEDYFYWLLRSGKLARRKPAVRGTPQRVSVVTAKRSHPKA